MALGLGNCGHAGAHSPLSGLPRIILLIALLGSACTPPSGSGLGAARVTPVPEKPPLAVYPTVVIGSRAKQFDQQFIDTMVPHHQAEIELARIALARVQHQDLLDLAQEIIDSETVEITDMQALREEWFGSNQTPPMTMTATIEALRSAPEPFDTAYIDALLPVQQQAIELSKRAVLEAGQQNILDLAGGILELHARQTVLMQSWRAEW
jgi:uncharacterized protein (DUF305 family)